MGKHRGIATPATPVASVPERTVGARIRGSRVLPVLAFSAALALVIVPMIDPSNAFAITAAATFEEQYGVRDAQTLLVGEGASAGVDRSDDYTVTEVQLAQAEASAPPAGKPDPGTAKSIAYELVVKHGWDDKQWACLVALWNRESHWNVYASNSGSGAYGIPQAVPGSKMASVGSDWQTNPKTQIVWGLGYISGRYGSPCGAWAHSENSGWY